MPNRTTSAEMLSVNIIFFLCLGRFESCKLESFRPFWNFFVITERKKFVQKLIFSIKKPFWGNFEGRVVKFGSFERK